MPDFEKDEFKFPDEVESSDEGFEIAVEDDTPEEDRGRQPMPKEIVEEIEKDELESYSDDVKTKFKQLKKVYHDERRAKEEADRERQAALEATQRLYAENQRIKSMLKNGEAEYVGAIKSSAEMQLEMAKKAYREAYDSGDPVRKPDCPGLGGSCHKGGAESCHHRPHGTGVHCRPGLERRGDYP